MSDQEYEIKPLPRPKKLPELSLLEISHILHRMAETPIKLPKSRREQKQLLKSLLTQSKENAKITGEIALCLHFIMQTLESLHALEWRVEWLEIQKGNDVY